MALSDVRVVNKGKDWISPEATAVAINPHKDDEYIVAKDDRTLSLWNFSGDKLQDSFDCNFIALSLAFSPPVMGSVATLPSTIGLESNYVIAAACSDGTLRILKRNGASTEKVVKAYDRGAATCAKWSLDGVSIVTAGEDGEVKVFSKSGNLRMTLASFNFAIHDVAWSPSGDAVAIACRNLICIHHTQKRKNVVRWQCHPDDHGTILCVDWSPINHLLVCGSEDGRYRIFDAFGAILLESSAQMSAVTSVSWSPKGDKFIVGLMGSLLLCNKYGQVLSKSSSNEGNYQLQWTADASRVLGVHGDGGIIQANVIGSEKEWNGFKMRQIGCCLISFQANGGDGSGDTTDEEIEYRDHIVDYEIGFQHAIVCSPKQCYVYDLYHLSNPIAVDLKSVVSFVAMSATNFALVTRTQGVLIYSYDGRNLSLIDVNCTLSSGGFSRNHISLSKDYVAFVDPQDKTNVQIMEARTGKKANDLQSAIRHDAKIDFVSLSKSRSNQTQAMMLIIDEKKDLFLCSICPETGRRKCELKKIGSHVSSAAWNEEYDQVAAISDSKILIWYQINSLHDDLFSMASECIDCPGIGKNPRIANFAKAAITVESSDGNKITTAISPVFETIHEYLLSNKWEKALHLCRFVENPKVWAMLTVLAIQNMNVEVAEAGLKACRLVDKLFHLQYIKSLKNEKEKQAELRKFCKIT